MIEKQCFTNHWITEKRDELGVSDRVVVEKTIHAFALLGHLAKLGIPLVFKGGTSLILRLPEFRRLSIDIDITCPLEDSELDKILQEISRKTPFIHYEEDNRGKDRLPARRHFKFHYAEPDNESGQSYHVLLDVVKEEGIHPKVERIPIKTNWIDFEEEVLVAVPTVEGLLGDKLTAFAPNTVGVPCYRKEVRPNFIVDTSMQVVKQLFDVAALFDSAQDFDQVRDTYDRIFEAENSYRGGKFTRQQALEDTIETSRLISIAELKGSESNDMVDLLLKGRNNLKGHLIGSRFNNIDFKVAAGKAGCLAKVLLDNDLKKLSGKFRYDESNLADLKKLRFKDDPILESLKRQSPEAFHYWALAHGKLGE